MHCSEMWCVCGLASLCLEEKKSRMLDLPTGTLTLLFTDIAGSTRLLQQVGDRYGSVLSECRQLLRAAFHQWNGHEVDTQGDAFFVVFARATDAVSASELTPLASLA